MKYNKSHSVNSFILKLYTLMERSKHCQIISWTEEGKSFEVLEPEKFTAKILPKYFKHKNLSSFIRQLNMYDFHKKPGESLHFSHPLFVCGGRDQLNLIKRKDSKKRRSSQKKLIKKISRLIESNRDLEGNLEKLEKMYEEVNNLNQFLISNLQKCQIRDQQLQEVLRQSLIYLNGINK